MNKVLASDLEIGQYALWRTDTKGDLVVMRIWSRKDVVVLVDIRNGLDTWTYHLDDHTIPEVELLEPGTQVVLDVGG